MRSHRRRICLLLALLALTIAPASGCGDDTAAASGDDTELIGDAPDGGDVEDGTDGGADTAAPPTCDQEGCADDSACTLDHCAEDGVTCVNAYDEALCCTADQCEIDGECFDNGAPNPDNACEVCLVVTAADAWSVDDTATCDDGSACTTGDQCLDGACVGAAVVCDDGDPCTDDFCDADTGGCSATPRTGACDDGDPCTTGEACVDGACVGGGPVTCEDGNGCTDGACDPATGACVFTPNDAACDDGDPCSAVDACQDGVCVGVEREACDDANVCTADFCDADGRCGHTSLDDLCVDENPCTDEACDPAQGCVYPFNTDPCEDGDLCTMADTCTQGACIGAPVPVDDANPCTDDTCNPAVGVLNIPNALACDDANACTVGDACADGGCLPGATPLDCDDADACTADACDPASGCIHTDITASCDDANACTTDSCDPVAGCRNALIVSFGCRPSIVIDFPARAATISAAGAQTVTVTGTVTSDAGAITSLTINGAAVAVDPATGAFSHTMPVQVGHNTLLIVAEDALGTAESRVQSFHWSNDYTQGAALPPGAGAVDPGLALWFGQETIDDGAPPPPTDLASIFKVVLDGFDLSSFFDPSTPIASSSGYDIYLTSLTMAGTDVALEAVDGGLRVTAALLDIEGDLFFDCTNFFCRLAGGDGTGGLTIDSVDVVADLAISVNPDHTLSVTVTSSTTTINSLDIFADNGWTNFLLSIAEAFIRDSLVADLESELNTQLNSVIGPLLGDALSALAFNLDFDLPRLDGATDPGTGDPITIPVALSSDFSFSDFQDDAPGPQGGALGLRAWATTPTRGVPAGDPFDVNLGVPMRVDCATGGAQQLLIPRVAPVEVVFADDTLNQILYAAWWGGLLELPVDPSLLGDVDLASFGISDLNMVISAWLPPLASDCGPGSDLRLYVGDLRIDADFNLFAQPVTMIVYASFEAPITLDAVGGELAITVSSVENVELEVNVAQEAMLGTRGVIADLLRTQLVPALGDLLGAGTPLASFPLPEVDLSASLGLPPGTVFIRILPISPAPAPSRQDGNTIVYGALE